MHSCQWHSAFIAASPSTTCRKVRGNECFSNPSRRVHSQLKRHPALYVWDVCTAVGGTLHSSRPQIGRVSGRGGEMIAFGIRLGACTASSNDTTRCTSGTYAQLSVALCIHRGLSEHDLPKSARK